MSSEPVRNETLPQLVRPLWGRLGLLGRVIAVALVVALVVGVAAYVASRSQATERFEQEATIDVPGFTLTYTDEMELLEPQGSELLRLESSLDGLLAERMTVVPFAVEPGSGTIASRLALQSVEFRRRAERRYRGYRPDFEGGTRLQGAEAYQIAFTAKYRSRRGTERALFGKIVLLPEDTPDPKRGLAIELVATTESPLREASALGNKSVLKQPFRSLRLLERQDD
ncbi:MAG: hypothetical protein ACR2NA_12855 [Solirubrobacterales bacterium]